MTRHTQAKAKATIVSRKKRQLSKHTYTTERQRETENEKRSEIRNGIDAPMEPAESCHGIGYGPGVRPRNRSVMATEFHAHTTHQRTKHTHTRTH